MVKHTFPPEAVKAGLSDYRKLVDREHAADAWMASERATEADKLKWFFKYKCEILDARLSYERLFRGLGIDFGEEKADETETV